MQRDTKRDTKTIMQQLGAQPESKRSGQPVVERKDEKAAQPEQKDTPVYRLNLIFLGTGYHLEQPTHQDIFTQLAQKIAVTDKQSVHLIDGIGGEAVPPKKEKSKKTKKGAEAKQVEMQEVKQDVPVTSDRPMLGTYNFSCEFDAKSGVITPKKTLKKSGAVTVAGGKLFAKGYHDAVKEARAVVEAMIAAKKVPLQIQTYGFSRGAWIANIVANDLYAYYGDKVIVNQFTIDAVAGPGRRHNMKGRLIPPNVGLSHNIMMKDESKPGFEPQDKRRRLVQEAEKTVVRFRQYRGRHGAALRLEKAKEDNDKVKRNYAAELAFDDVLKFNEACGVVMREPLVLLERAGRSDKYQELKQDRFTDKERLERYTQMKLAYTEKANAREFTKNPQDYVLHAYYYFEDKNHQELFAKLYPHYFDRFFQKNAGGSTDDQVKEDIARIVTDDDLATTLYKADYQHFIKGKDDKFVVKQEEKLEQDEKEAKEVRTILAPTGISLLAADFAEDKPIAANSLAQLISSIQVAANNASLVARPYVRNVASTLLKRMHSIIHDPHTHITSKHETYLLLKAEVKHAIARLGNESRIFGSTFSQLRFQLDGIMQQRPLSNVMLNCFGDLMKNPHAVIMINQIFRGFEGLMNQVAAVKDMSPETKKDLIAIHAKIIQNKILQNEKIDPGLKNQMIESSLLLKLELMKFDPTPKPKLNYLDYVTHKLKNFSKTTLQKYLQNALKQMRDEKINNPTLLKQLIDFAMHRAALLRSTNKEDDFEKQLRKLQSGLIPFADMPLEQNAQKLLADFKGIYESSTPVVEAFNLLEELDAAITNRNRRLAM